MSEALNNLDLIGTCVSEALINDLFGSVTDFAQAIEEHGNNFVRGNLVVSYDEDTDIHTFYLKDKDNE
jgi:hypothetical protein